VSAIGKRYARAAVDAAFEQGGSTAVEALYEGLSRFCSAYHASEELRELMHNPVFEDQRERVLGLVLDKLEASTEVRGLIRLLAERNRISVLDAVALEVEAIADERAGRLRAHVTSAIELLEPQIERIARALERRVGRSIVVRVTVDPEILGGLICRVGDLTLDSSLRRQLEILREQLERQA
jgi:F-type H+-transporting ATPase subunit delta